MLPSVLGKLQARVATMFYFNWPVSKNFWDLQSNGKVGPRVRGKKQSINMPWDFPDVGFSRQRLQSSDHQYVQGTNENNILRN